MKPEMDQSGPAMLSNIQFQRLQQIAALHHRSLPVYLTYARPWVRSGREMHARVIEDIAADHHELVEKILGVLREDGRPVLLGDFPLAFTNLNDLAFDFILKELIRYERHLKKTLETMVDEFPPGSVYRGVVDYGLGMAAGHLQNLEDAQGDSPAMRPY